MNKNKKVQERISLYIPKGVYTKIDAQRVDIPRSKFILRIIEKYLRTEV